MAVRCAVDDGHRPSFCEMYSHSAQQCRMLKIPSRAWGIHKNRSEVSIARGWEAVEPFVGPETTQRGRPHKGLRVARDRQSPQWSGVAWKRLRTPLRPGALLKGAMGSGGRWGVCAQRILHGEFGDF